MRPKILSVVGARPQFIKAKPVIAALKKRGLSHILVHTGQHYDYEMSKIFFNELHIPEPSYNLKVGSAAPVRQVGMMADRIEKVLNKEKPDIVLVFGDTNSTLAGALAASKLNISVAHVEAGLRSYNIEMPEEINRIIADHLSDILFCPTKASVNNLAKEGVRAGVYLVGDTMYDAVLNFMKIALRRSSIMKDLHLEKKNYLLATIHRAGNTDISGNLAGILKGLGKTGEKVILPLHPRTQRSLNGYGLKIPCNVRIIKPAGYLDMLILEKNARMILTDSGGIQKEAYWLGVPCVTMRDETEWIETIASGWNVLTGCDPDRIAKEVRKPRKPAARPSFYGDGHASKRIVDRLIKTYRI